FLTSLLASPPTAPPSPSTTLFRSHRSYCQCTCRPQNPSSALHFFLLRVCKFEFARRRLGNAAHHARFLAADASDLVADASDHDEAQAHGFHNGIRAPASFELGDDRGD